MHKILALVGNENLKIRHRKLLWIALIIIIVASLFLSVVLGFFSRLSLFDQVFNEPFAEYCQRQIDNAQDELRQIRSKKNNIIDLPDTGFPEEGIDKDPEMDYDEQMYLRDLYQFQILLRSGADWDDWRYTTGICYTYGQIKAEGNTEDANYLEGIILRNDYCEYYRYLMRENERTRAPEELEAANAGYLYCIEHKIVPDTNDWRYNLAMKMSEALLKGDQDDYLLIQYRLDHNVRVNPGNSFGGSETAFVDSTTMAFISMLESGYTETSTLWNALVITQTLTSVVQIFSVILAASIVASEFGKGTVKFLLIAPAARWKILLSKYLSLLLNMCIFFFTLLFCNLLFCCLFCNGKDLFLPIVSVSEGVVKHSSPILLLLRNYLLSFVSMIVVATFAFSISSLFRISGLAVGVSLLAVYSVSTVNSILALGAQIPYFGFLDSGRYLIFANLDLVKILDGTSLFPHQSFGVAIVVLALHMAVFLWTAFDAFDRKEI